jgi:putative membrane protein
MSDQILQSPLAVVPVASSSNLSAQDASFLSEAQTLGAAEVQEAKLATTNASDPGISVFATWMNTDHTVMNALLQQVAQQYGVQPAPPDSQEQGELLQLQSLSGTQFDNSYAADQVHGHQATLSLFEQEASMGQNPEVKALAEQAVPILQAHLNGAVSLANSLNPGFATPVSVEPTPMLGPSGPPVGHPNQQDINFVQQAAMGGMTEVAEGQLAASKSGFLAVSEFGQWMVGDHSAMGATLTSLAEQEGVQVPMGLDAQHQAEIASLKSLSGDLQFSKAYIDDQVTGHEQTLMQFVQEANSGADPLLTTFAKGALPVLEQHFLSAVAVAEQLGVSGASSAINELAQQLTTQGGIGSDIAKSLLSSDPPPNENGAVSSGSMMPDQTGQSQAMVMGYV